MIKRFLIFIIFGAVFFVHISTARSFSVSPLKQLLTLSAGTQNQVVTITARNDEDFDQVFNLKVLSLKQLDNGRVVYGQDLSPAEAWVEPIKESISLLAGQEEKIDFVINIPANTLAGTYYLGLAIEPNLSEKGDLGVSGQVASILILQVAGLVKESLEIEEWHLPKIVFSKNWENYFSVKNTGPVDLPLAGKITISDPFGQQVVSQTISMGAVLLPSSGRKIGGETILPKNLFFPGPYSAAVLVKYGLTEQSATAMLHVWYFPPLFVFFLIALVILVVIFLVNRQRRKKYL